jgi:hypothetical protein
MRQATSGPILVELGEDRWDAFIDSVADWLRTVRLAQGAYRTLAEETAEALADPRMKEALERIVETAKVHEDRVDELYALIVRNPPRLANLLGEVAGKARQGLGYLLGLAGGAPGAWNDLRQLLLANLSAIGAFGAAEQLGLTLGLPELARISFEIVRDKSVDQLIIEELMLELAPQAILYDDDSLGRSVGHRSEPPAPVAEGGSQPRFPEAGVPADPIVGDEMDRSSPEGQET